MYEHIQNQNKYQKIYKFLAPIILKKNEKTIKQA